MTISQPSPLPPHRRSPYSPIVVVSLLLSFASRPHCRSPRLPVVVASLLLSFASLLHCRSSYTSVARLPSFGSSFGRRLPIVVRHPARSASLVRLLIRPSPYLSFVSTVPRRHPCRRLPRALAGTPVVRLLLSLYPAPCRRILVYTCTRVCDSRTSVPGSPLDRCCRCPVVTVSFAFSDVRPSYTFPPPRLIVVTWTPAVPSDTPRCRNATTIGLPT